MIQRSFHLGSMREFGVCLEDAELHKQAFRSRSVLIQLFAPSIDPQDVASFYERIEEQFPKAVVVGITTAGEICEGECLQRRIVVTFSFFELSMLHPIALPCRQGEEEATGRRLVHHILFDTPDNPEPLKGVLLYATTQRMDAAALLDGMRGQFGEAPLFGAGAGSYHNNGQAWIFAEGRLYEDGAVAVAFRGEELEIEAYPCLGWEPLSRAMTVTEIGNPTLIKTLDGIPAASVYEKYLGIQNDENFFNNMLEFPLMLKRDGATLARVPLTRGAKGSLQLVADVHIGEQVRIAYGNPKHIIEAAHRAQQKLAEFRPEGILVFSCYCRQVYLREGLNLETEGFRQIAPSAGFYTYGEFYGKGQELTLHNATMVAVGMREGSQTQPLPAGIPEKVGLPELQPMEMTARLARFVGVVVEELEQANRELQELMQTDGLTGLYNRRKMDELLVEAIKTGSEKRPLSIVLLDIDWFKRINDTHGHLFGDEVLKRAASILLGHLGDSGGAGRWGGEEFLLLLRDTGADIAAEVAERIRVELEQTDFGAGGAVTASFGVTAAVPGEETRQLFKRADEALYAAKHGGRNRVVVH